MRPIASSLASVAGFTGLLFTAGLAHAEPEALPPENPPLPAPPAPPATRPPAPVAPPAAATTNGDGAEGSDAKEKKKEKEDHFAYVSFSPIHLLFPIVEVTAEFRVHRKIGVAAIGGIGSIDPYMFQKRPLGVSSSRFTVWEVGGQFLAYPVGSFDHGMQLGMELLYAGIAGSMSNATTTASGTGQGLAVGPLVGYKFTAPVGFALNIQGGVQYMAVRAEATSGSQLQRASDSRWGPLLNLNIGWAF